MQSDMEKGHAYLPWGMAWLCLAPLLKPEPQGQAWPQEHIPKRRMGLGKTASRRLLGMRGQHVQLSRKTEKQKRTHFFKKH